MNNIPDNEDIRLAEESRREQMRGERTIGRCDYCGEAILDGEDYYKVNEDLIHRDCGVDWLEYFRVT